MFYFYFFVESVLYMIVYIILVFMLFTYLYLLFYCHYYILAQHQNHQQASPTISLISDYQTPNHHNQSKAQLPGSLNSATVRLKTVGARRNQAKCGSHGGVLRSTFYRRYPAKKIVISSYFEPHETESDLHLAQFSLFWTIRGEEVWP